MPPKPERDDRRQVRVRNGGASDTRTEAARDRDRVLYSSALRRLAGVTQVVSAAEGHVFHNRLTHTLKVAQVGRRLAEHLARVYQGELKASGVAIDAEVVEAAALAHDLGHPPFGHIGELALSKCVRDARLPEGYEGNAQSFRIVTRLAEYRSDVDGLDLTRATRAAILKYPWFYLGNPPGKSQEKFGAYKSDEEDLREACEGRLPQTPSLEAQLMDHADAVTYSVHDLDDFYRAGLIPLQTVATDLSREMDRFRKREKSVSRAKIDEHAEELERWFKLLFQTGHYRGTATERAALHARSSQLIEKFVSPITISFSGDYPRVVVPDDAEVFMAFLQYLVREYVINNARLATQQHGQQQIIERLFVIYREQIHEKRGAAERLVPPAFAEQLAVAQKDDSLREERSARLAADIVSSFTDAQAVRMDARLSGTAYGAITDLVD